MSKYNPGANEGSVSDVIESMSFNNVFFNYFNIEYYISPHIPDGTWCVM